MGAKKIKKVWHHYLSWEDYHNGMYRSLYGEEKSAMLKKAVEFTGDPELYGGWMLKVVEQWPICCEQNLTATNMNLQAWIGHAAACMAIGSPDEITRAAWSELTQDQQDRANKKADEAIAYWRDLYAKQNS
jgi:hypothetical protein